MTALIVLAGLNMSVLFPANRIAAEAGFPFLPYVFLYALGGGLGVAALAALRGHAAPLRAEHIKAHVISGALGFALPFSILAFVAGKLPSGVAALLLVLTPVFTYVIALLVRAERFRVANGIGLALALAGILLIVVPNQALPAAGMAGWFAVALLVPVSFATLNVRVEVRSPPAVPPLALAAGTLLVGALELLPLIVATGQLPVLWTFVDLGPGALLALAAAIVVNAIMYPMFYLIVSKAGAFQFSAMNIVALLAANVWGIAFFAERHSVFVWVAMALMLAGFVVTVARPASGRATVT